MDRAAKAFGLKDAGRGRASSGLVTLGLICAVASCDDPTPPPLFEGSVELGVGEAAFEDATDGQAVNLVFGIQGGHHVWISLRAHGFADHDRWLMDLDVVPLATGEPPPRSAPVRVALTKTGEREHELVGYPAVLYEASCFVDVPLSYRVTLTDPLGNQVSDELTLVPAGGAPGLEDCAR